MLQLAVGQVFHLWCAVCRPPKMKFFVLAEVDPRPLFFLINSNPAPFQQARPVLLAHQVPVLKADHGFLAHDSVLDCTGLMGGYSASDLEDAHAKDAAVLIGQVSPAASAAARQVIGSSVLLSRRDIESLLAAWI